MSNTGFADTVYNNNLYHDEPQVVPRRPLSFDLPHEMRSPHPPAVQLLRRSYINSAWRSRVRVVGVVGILSSRACDAIKRKL